MLTNRNKTFILLILLILSFLTAWTQATGRSLLLVFFHYKGGVNNSHCAVSEKRSRGLLTMTSDSSTCHAVCACCALSGEQGPLCSLCSVNRVIEQFPVWWFAKSKLLLDFLAPHQEGRSRSGVPTGGERVERPVGSDASPTRKNAESKGGLVGSPR